MELREQDQDVGAQVVVDPGGKLVFAVRRGLLPGSTFAALAAGLGPLPDQCYEYLQSAV